MFPFIHVFLLIVFCSFHCTNFSLPWLIPKDFILFGAIVNGIVFVISFSSRLLLVYRNAGRAWWLMSVIPALWEDNLRPGVRDQPGQHGESPPLLKIQKLAGHGGRHL